MTNYSKPNIEYIIIDELLSYIQNKISVVDDATLIRICLLTFTKKEIERSKVTLFETVPIITRGPIRRYAMKEERDLAEIINVFRTTREEDIPVFVAMDLEKLPPTTLDEIQMCKDLLNDIVNINAKIDNMKRRKVNNNLQEIRNEILPLKSMFEVIMQEKFMSDDSSVEYHSCTHESYDVWFGRLEDPTASCTIPSNRQSMWFEANRHNRRSHVGQWSTVSTDDIEHDFIITKSYAVSEL